jgi:hypothetical protein
MIVRFTASTTRYGGMMADVERERVTALWRDAAAALEQDADDAWTYSEEPFAPLHIGPCAECGRLREQLDAARQALREIAGHDGHTAFEYCVPMMVEAARAALGVEGEQEKP